MVSEVLLVHFFISEEHQKLEIFYSYPLATYSIATPKWGGYTTEKNSLVSPFWGGPAHFLTFTLPILGWVLGVTLPKAGSDFRTSFIFPTKHKSVLVWGKLGHVLIEVPPVK